ncbi:hypothetical protein DFP73DRAFT_153637 [Morchella snyderi]|nr:hypothetical protein DFP73DRAFT_153637 [Morchella snyderi]
MVINIANLTRLLTIFSKLSIMKATIYFALSTLLFATQVFTHANNLLHRKSPGISDKNDPEASQDLEKQEPGYVPELMAPISLPSGLDGSFCADKTGFCGSKDACCSMGGVCCPSGGCCNEPGTGCFPDKDGRTLCCKVTEKLCGNKTCIPKNTTCCRNGSYCDAGSTCVKGGCCKAGTICNKKTGAKSSGPDTRAIKPSRLKTTT